MNLSCHIETDADHWNALVSDSSFAHFMQTWEWGEYKSRLGWKPCRLFISDSHKMYAGAQILFKSLPCSPWTIGYIPRGPMISPDNTDLWQCLQTGLNDLARQNNAIVVRIEPACQNRPELRDRLSAGNYRQIFQTNQPRCTFLIDLPEDEGALLEKFDRNTRRLIHKAEREGVTIEESDARGIDLFYEQLCNTNKRKHLPMQSLDFYRQAYLAFEPKKEIKIFLARYQDQIVSSLIVFFHQRNSNHLWAGNSVIGLKSHASHLLHWTAMKTAIQKGCTRCDLWGIPDEIADAMENGEPVSCERSDGLWGVYRFKAGFGGSIHCFVGTYDYVLKPKIYWLMQKVMSGQKTMDRISSLLHRF